MVSGTRIVSCGLYFATLLCIRIIMNCVVNWQYRSFPMKSNKFINNYAATKKL